jgi:hypothetical protein
MLLWSPQVEVPISLAKFRLSGMHLNIKSNFYVHEDGKFAVCLNKKAATGAFLRALSLRVRLRKENVQKYSSQLLNGNLTLLTMEDHTSQ